MVVGVVVVVVVVVVFVLIILLLLLLLLLTPLPTTTATTTTTTTTPFFQQPKICLCNFVYRQVVTAVVREVERDTDSARTQTPSQICENFAAYLDRFASTGVLGVTMLVLMLVAALVVLVMSIRWWRAQKYFRSAAACSVLMFCLCMIFE